MCPRYASLYFCCAVEDQDNELITLEIIHRYVELLDKYFGSVSLLIITHVICWLMMLRGEGPTIYSRNPRFPVRTGCPLICYSLCCCGLTGVRAGYYLQLREGLLYPGWVPVGWRGTGDIQEECAESNWAGRPAAGGTYCASTIDHNSWVMWTVVGLQLMMIFTD